MKTRAAEFYRQSELFDATIGSAISRHVAAQAERPAIVMARDDLLTFGALGAEIAAFGNVLRENGLGSSAKVAIVLPDGVELALAIVATAAHAIAVPLNPKLSKAELERVFITLHIDALLTVGQFARAARELAAQQSVRVLELMHRRPRILNVYSIIASALQKDEAASSPVQPDAVAIIVCTSATSGRAKLVPLTHRNLLMSVERRRYDYDITRDDRALCAAPLYYSQGIRGTLLAPLLLGASVAIPDRRAGDDIIDWLVNLEPTWYHAAQPLHLDILERAQLRQGRPLRHRLRFIRSGATPLSLAVRQGLEEVFGVPVLDGYGLSETGTVASNSTDPERRKPGTVGRPFPDDLAIRGEDGRMLPPGAVGEIVVRGPTLTPGYIGDDEANRAAFVDGWFRTGDLGSIDADGFLTLLGRIKEFINRGGEKISPYEIEAALLLHPCIREAAAFSVPHPRLGENVAVAVVLAPGANTTSAEIRTFLLDYLAASKIPQQVLVKIELPKGATGKILRRQLTEEAAHCARTFAPPAVPLHHQILEIWQRLLGHNDIGINDDFFEVGGDSLLATQMICEVEALIRQRIPPSALKAVFTVRELAAAVVHSSPATIELITCVKQGRSTPFLFCHGDFTGRGFYALKLADMMVADQSVFLVHPFPDPDPQITIEEMAKSYLPHILKLHPTGPLRLGGYCNGGLLAWEIAHQLEQMHREVEFVALVDVPSLNARRGIRAIAQLNRFLFGLAPKRFSQKYAHDGMCAVWARGKRRTLYGPYSRAISNYIPPSLKTQTLCVMSDEGRGSIRYFWSPWGNLTDRVRCEYVPGTHHSCITKYVGQVAGALDRLVEQATLQ